MGEGAYGIGSATSTTHAGHRRLPGLRRRREWSFPATLTVKGGARRPGRLRGVRRHNAVIRPDRQHGQAEVDSYLSGEARTSTPPGEVTPQAVGFFGCGRVTPPLRHAQRSRRGSLRGLVVAAHAAVALPPPGMVCHTPPTARPRSGRRRDPVAAGGAAFIERVQPAVMCLTGHISKPGRGAIGPRPWSIRRPGRRRYARVTFDGGCSGPSCWRSPEPCAASMERDRRYDDAWPCGPGRW